jgi:hypothetical protein
VTDQGDQGRGGSMTLIGRPGRASSPADARHRGGDGLYIPNVSQGAGKRSYFRFRINGLRAV